jgi:hypothetical protein
MQAQAEVHPEPGGSGAQGSVSAEIPAQPRQPNKASQTSSQNENVGTQTNSGPNVDSSQLGLINKNVFKPPLFGASRPVVIQKDPPTGHRLGSGSNQQQAGTSTGAGVQGGQGSSQNTQTSRTNNPSSSAQTDPTGLKPAQTSASTQTDAYRDLNAKFTSFGLTSHQRGKIFKYAQQQQKEIDQINDPGARAGAIGAAQKTINEMVDAARFPNGLKAAAAIVGSSGGIAALTYAILNIEGKLADDFSSKKDDKKP